MMFPNLFCPEELDSCHPATMTHLGMGPEGRAAAGISDALLRLSVGLEAEADLIADIAQALEAA